jgi:glucan phosphoethanolaminetransferase (alkaline phosphatase superfamily)
MNRVNVGSFVSLTLTAVVMAGAVAHLLELPAKMKLNGPEYLTVQQIYRGWALLGIVIYAALAATLVLLIMVRAQRRVLRRVVLAILCMVAAQVVFWGYTYPVNQETSNWTLLPEHWQQLRVRWEFSHAVGAVLQFSALTALVASLLVREAR